MAVSFNTYSGLKAALQDWMDRADVTAKAADCIALAEARFNRELKMVATDATLTGTWFAPHRHFRPRHHLPDCPVYRHRRRRA
jgi:hypothetical protein